MKTSLRHPCSSLLIAASLLCAGSAFAQQSPELPAPSPHAKAEQRVGLTDMSVDYSSPGVKGRPIWGTLVPYGAPWRTGANAPTKLTSSKDFKLGDKAVPAGTYALHTIPAKTGWTVVLSTATDAWDFAGPDPKKEVARITVKAVPLVKSRERMAFIFSETTESSTRLDLEWEKLRVSIPLAVDTKPQVMANIARAVDDAWRPHWSSAKYLLENGGDLAKALEYINGSIAIKATWWNHWVRAQILAKQGNTAEAIAAAQKAQELGKGDKIYEGNFKDEIAKTLAGWQQKKK